MDPSKDLKPCPTLGITTARRNEIIKITARMHGQRMFQQFGRTWKIRSNEIHSDSAK